METTRRAESWARLAEERFDVAVVGGGIQGAVVAHTLRGLGAKVLLLDAGDFGGGTSQASGQLVWGGASYLARLDIPTVRSLSSAREELLRAFPDDVVPRDVRYVSSSGARRAAFVRAGLEAYWLLGQCRRRRPRLESRYEESRLLRHAGPSVRFQEAALADSDCRFVLRWAASLDDGQSIALPHCALRRAAWRSRDAGWRLELGDRLRRTTHVATASRVVNCAGVHVDGVNELGGVRTPWRHILGRGVFVILRRPQGQESTLVLDTEDRDVICSIPWGPVALWGPTETLASDPATGFSPTRRDLEILAREARRHLVSPPRRDEIVGLRCGVRPLVVRRGESPPPDLFRLSKRHRIHRDTRRGWVSVYGGKLTACMHVARDVVEALEPHVATPRIDPPPPLRPRADRETIRFPGLGRAVVSPGFARRHEACHTLADWLRRRTPIAQWIPRGGLGSDDENLSLLEAAATDIHGGDRGAGRRDLESYLRHVEDQEAFLDTWPIGGPTRALTSTPGGCS